MWVLFTKKWRMTRSHLQCVGGKKKQSHSSHHFMIHLWKKNMHTCKQILGTNMLMKYPWTESTRHSLSRSLWSHLASIFRQLTGWSYPSLTWFFFHDWHKCCQEAAPYKECNHESWHFHPCKSSKVWAITGRGCVLYFQVKMTHDDSL